MKRESYTVTLLDRSITKYAWNSACKAGEKLVGDLADQEKTIYNLVDHGYCKDGWKFQSAYYTWKRADGKIVNVEIKKNGVTP